MGEPKPVPEPGMNPFIDRPKGAILEPMTPRSMVELQLKQSIGPNGIHLDDMPAAIECALLLDIRDLLIQLVACGSGEEHVV